MATAAKTKGTGAEELPQSADLAAGADVLRQFTKDTRHAKALGFLGALAASPPQVLLFEGGSAQERSAAALYWAALLNCPDAGEGKAPCLACPVCLKIAGRQHRDLFYLDGLAESIKIEPVRAVKAVLGEAPREARRRVVILAEAQALTEPAANALLKSLEEPSTSTVFVLLAPQRERLLPTLVSRSWVLTLAWPDSWAGNTISGSVDSGVQEWEAVLAAFLLSGRGLFEKSGARGTMDAQAAGVALLAWQRSLTAAMSGKNAGPLSQIFGEFSDASLRLADEVFAEGQDSLRFMVNPALVVEWMATRLYLLRMQSQHTNQ